MKKTKNKKSKIDLINSLIFNMIYEVNNLNNFIQICSIMNINNKMRQEKVNDEIWNELDDYFSNDK